MTAARLRVGIRLAARRSTLPPFVVLSLAGHVVFAVALVFLPSLRPAPSFPMEPAIEAVLMPAPTPRRPEPPAPTTPVVEPEPEPPKEEVTAAPEDPPPDPEPPPKPKPKPPARTEKPAPKSEPSKRPSGTDRPTASPSGPVGNPDGGDALAGMGAEFNWYRDAVARALYTSWQQPVLNAAQPVEVAVAFEIVRNGAVRNVRIERGSGLPAVDRSVLRAVHDASLPPLPRNYGRAAQPALFVFRLYPE